MEIYKSYEKKDLSHSHICRMFLEGALLIWLLRTAISIVYIVQLCFQPEAAIKLVDNGYSYRLDMFAGYVQCAKEQLPTGAEMVSDKVFCITHIFLFMITKDFPVLIVLGYLRKIMNVIRISHSPFVVQTRNYTGKIGTVLIVTGIFGNMVFQMGMGLIVYHVPHLVNPLEFSWIFAGVIVLLVRDILKWGCELQEFSDETL